MAGRAISVRSSAIHGRGVFALRRIAKGVRLIEYKGARRRWSVFEDDGAPCTYLFDVEGGLVIDPAVGGNSARFINHSCAPNCEAVLEDGRIFIETIREIGPGEELLYDYALSLGRRPTRADLERHACRCGSDRCRGTMLARKTAGRSG
jgi:hypothetical protein